MSIGENLKRIRRKKDISQQELSERSKVSVYTISRLESGTTKFPHDETLEALAEVLGCTLNDLREGIVVEQALDRRRGPRQLVATVNHATLSGWHIEVNHNGTSIRLEKVG